MSQGPSQPTIPVSCQCGRRFQAKPELAGKRLKCPACGQAIAVPQLAAVPLDALIVDDDPLGLGAAGSGPAAANTGGRLLSTSPGAYGTAKRRKASGGNKGLWIAAGVGGGCLLVLLVLLVIGAGWLLSSKSSPPVAAGSSPDAAATPPAAIGSPSAAAPSSSTPSQSSTSLAAPRPARCAQPAANDPAGGEVQVLFALPEKNNALLLPAVGCAFVAGSGQVFDVRKRAAVGKCEGALNDTGAKKALSPDGTYYAYEAKSGQEIGVEVASCQTGEKTHTLDFGEAKVQRLLDLLCDKQGRLIAVARTAGGNGVFIWNLADGKLVQNFTVDGSINDRATSVDDAGQLLAIGTTAKLRVYDLAQGKQVADLAAPSGPLGTSHFIYLKEPAFSPDAKEVAGLVPVPSGGGMRLIVWDIQGPIKDEFPLALQIGGAYNYNRPVQYLPQNDGWVLHGDYLLDRKLRAIVWILQPPPLANYYSHPLLDADHVLAVRGSPQREMVSVTLPRKELRAAVEAMSAGKEALLKHGDAVTVTVEVGETRFADKAGVASELQTLLTKRLVDGGLAVAPTAAVSLHLKYSESQGKQLQVVEGPGVFGRPTGQTVQETVIVLDAKMVHQATQKTIWTRQERMGNPHMLRGGEVSDQAVRKQTFSLIQYRLQSMPIPYFVAADPAAPQLPIILKL